MSQLKCSQLTLGYNGKPVIENINFSVEQGDYLCIAGPNGSGKSTLVKAIMNLQQPISGSITYGDNLKKGEIGYLPQQTAIQRDFPASVYEIVLSGCQKNKFLPFYTNKQKQYAFANMEKMGISHLANKCYRYLSGGQQQRVLLARALCATVKMILLDEPVAGLDPQATEDMYNLVKSINKSGTTIIMVSHDIPAVVKQATHVLYLGNSPFFGTLKECVECGILQERNDIL